MTRTTTTRSATTRSATTDDPATTIYESNETRHAAAPDPTRGIQEALFSTEPAVPLSIFSTELSALQAVVRYLSEARKLSFTEIAALLNRSPKTVWTTYAHAKELAFTYTEDALAIPLSRFSRRDLAPLEALVTYLLRLGFSNVEAARLLKLDPRTTWTVAKRAERKRATNAENDRQEVAR